MKHKIIHITASEDPTKFFQFCLSNELYKTDSDTGFVSRMKNVFTGVRDFVGLTACITTQHGKPIGLCMIEHQDYLYTTKAGYLHLDARVRKNPWAKQLDWDFINLGLISFYVKPECRGLGVAHSMLEKMELFMASLHMREENRENVFLLTAYEKSYNIISNSRLFYPNQFLVTQRNHNQTISQHTYQTIFEEKKKKTIFNFSESTPGIKKALNF